MITCREDLIGTYVDGRNVELGNAYQKLLFKFGVKWLDFDDQEVRVAGDSTFTDHFCFDGDKLSWNSRHFSECNYKKELTERDLKPKPTKFVKVEESIFDLKGEFERGELYCKNLCASDDYTRLSTEVALFGCAAADNIYRKVEIDWRDEVKKLNKSAIFHDDGDLFLVIDSNSSDFISMCHEIASLTEKPTN